jgi:cell division protein FtsA
MGKVPANREILEVIPHQYKLDGQDNIKNPLGMTGTRLEIDAHIVSAMAPHLQNLQKSAETAKVHPNEVVVAGVAASRAVLTEHQIENGVVLIDIGGATTNIAIYEEGDLQYAAVVPVGGINITNDLAIGLKINPEIAEQLKIEHASAKSRKDSSGVSLKFGEEIYSFNTDEIDEIVEARLEELFELINRELKRAGRAGKLPSGAVITGGSAKLKGIVEYTKEALGLAASIGVASGYGGVVDDIDKPQFATAIGLMLIDSEMGSHSKQTTKSMISKETLSGGLGIISKLMGKFRS